MAGIRPLPRSLDPLMDESLMGYLLRLAHRLDLSPQRIAVLTGLTHGWMHASGWHMLGLQGTVAADFAHATRLTPEEVSQLGLLSLAACYPPLDPTSLGRRRQLAGLMSTEPWVFTRSTRYCPQCLTGSDSLIEQQHGGAWKKLWRLPVIFACLRHHRLLRHDCPACGQPVHPTTGRRPGLIRTAGRSGLHPTQCRNAAPEAPPGPPPSRVPVCGADLTTPGSPDRQRDERLPEHLVDLQERLLRLLDPHDPQDPASCHVLGEPTSGVRYFTDLRLVARLVSASWPAARHLHPVPDLAARLDEHMVDLHRLMHDHRERARKNREIVFHDAPALPAAAGAGLLAIADQILTTDNPAAASTLVHDLLAHSPLAPAWARRFLQAQAYCSPALAAVVQPVIEHLTGLPAGRRKNPPPAPHLRFDHRHIPQRLPAHWYDEAHCADLTGISPLHLHRILAIKLVHLTCGGSLYDAGSLIGIPRGHTHYTLMTVRPWLTETANNAQFQRCLQRLAEILDSTPDLIDYGARRGALETWTISPQQWDDVRSISWRSSSPQAMTAPGPKQRLFASLIVWEHITHGEFHFAPMLPATTTPDQKAIRRYATLRRWMLMTSSPTRNLCTLRARLTSLANNIATRIDTGDWPDDQDTHATNEMPQDRPRAAQLDQITDIHTREYFT